MKINLTFLSLLFFVSTQSFAVGFAKITTVSGVGFNSIPPSVCQSSDAESCFVLKVSGEGVESFSTAEGADSFSLNFASDQFSFVRKLSGGIVLKNCIKTIYLAAATKMNLALTWDKNQESFSCNANHGPL